MKATKFFNKNNFLRNGEKRNEFPVSVLNVKADFMINEERWVKSGDTAGEGEAEKVGESEAFSS
jgi:hypothetical protein